MMSRQQKKVFAKSVADYAFSTYFPEHFITSQPFVTETRIITIHPKSYVVHLKCQIEFKFDLEFYEKALFGSGGKTLTDGSRQYSRKMFLSSSLQET